MFFKKPEKPNAVYESVMKHFPLIKGTVKSTRCDKSMKKKKKELILAIKHDLH